jgi:hypothetical protein
MGHRSGGGRDRSSERVCIPSIRISQGAYDTTLKRAQMSPSGMIHSAGRR